MFCTNCGSDNPNGLGFCTTCGAKLGVNEAPQQAAAPQAAAPAAPVQVNDGMTLNIILTVASLLCCGGLQSAIFAVLGIVFGSQAKSAAAAGNAEEAQSKAKLAKIMAIIACVMIGLSLVAFIIIFALYGVALIPALMASMNM